MDILPGDFFLLEIVLHPRNIPDYQRPEALGRPDGDVLSRRAAACLKQWALITNFDNGPPMGRSSSQSRAGEL